MSGIGLLGVTKRFGRLVAVDRVDLQIHDGEFVTLLGPSGCGKTTTLRLLAGFLAPDEGRIVVDGEVYSSPERCLPPERRQMGMVFQSYAVWLHRTVFENVGFGLKVRRRPAAEIRDRVGTMLRLVGLDGLEDRYAAQLSGGQQQRVALARSLIVEPRILLLDEPLSNLDAKLRERMRVELKQLQRRTGITFVSSRISSRTSRGGTGGSGSRISAARGRGPAGAPRSGRCSGTTSGARRSEIW